jgi:hypothetical protein
VTETTAAAYRPSPRPRPAGTPSRPAPNHLHVVPAPNTLQPETATGEATPTDDVSAAQIVSDGANPGARRLQIAGLRALYGRTRDYWTPPAIFTDQPASLADLADYARTAAWAHQPTGPLRAAGISFHYGIGYPYTVYSRYREWAFQRPGRLTAHLAGIKLLALTGPGIWLADHLIYPAARLVGHILL